MNWEQIYNNLTEVFEDQFTEESLWPKFAELSIENHGYKDTVIQLLSQFEDTHYDLVVNFKKTNKI